MFDDRGNKVFSNIPSIFNVGPRGREQVYTAPASWTRFGLHVLGKYENDYWLDPFQHPQNWYRAFHGTGNAQNSDFDEKDQSSDTQFMPVDALASIYQSGFRTARNAVYGQGVYCSPNPKFPESGYIRAVSIEIKNDKKSYKCMLQVAVNPDGVAFHANNEIWVVADPKNIRPYGILIKEA